MLTSYYNAVYLETSQGNNAMTNNINKGDNIMIYIPSSRNEMIQYLLRDEYANWSYDAAVAIIDYLEQLSDDIGEPVELNRVDIRCQFSEFDKDGLEFNYGYIKADADDDIIGTLLANTIVIELPDDRYLISTEF